MQDDDFSLFSAQMRGVKPIKHDRADVGKPKADRKKRAEEGLRKLLGRDSNEAEKELEEASAKLADQKAKEAKKRGGDEGAVETVSDVISGPAGEQLTLIPDVNPTAKKTKAKAKAKARAK